MTTRRRAPSPEGFGAFGLKKNLLRAISEAGFETPRPIQAKTIPQALEGRDVLGLAQTGTGKTAAFALPIIDYLSESRGRLPRALILAPTRELALQISAEIAMLARYAGVKAATVIGGVSANPQVRALRARPDIIVACPGRLLDLVGSGDARLDDIEILVLDEADHMLDMGFLPDIKRVIAQLPDGRQNLLFSATMPKEIRALTQNLLHDPHVAEIGHAAPLETIEHALYPVAPTQKAALLRHLLSGEDFRSAIVFLRTKYRAKRLARDLDRDGHRAVALQGNMSQGQRERAMQGFRDGTYDVLVATDIAARGIDVAHVSHVINFDVPNTPEAYTHRIGRTGRAERSGKAYTFVTTEDREAIRAIERKLGVKLPRVEIEDYSVDRPGRESAPRNARGPSRRGGGSGSRQPKRTPSRSKTPPRAHAKRRPATQGKTRASATSESAPRPARSASRSSAEGFGTTTGTRRSTGNREDSGAPPKLGANRRKLGRGRR